MLGILLLLDEIKGSLLLLQIIVNPSSDFLSCSASVRIVSVLRVSPTESLNSPIQFSCVPLRFSNSIILLSQ